MYPVVGIAAALRSQRALHPVLFTLAGWPVRSYAVFVGLGFLAAGVIRHLEVRRLGYARTPGHVYVGAGALLGAMVGSKLGMVLFATDMEALWEAALSLDFTGKTVVGGIGGAWIGVEVTKRIVGVTHSTGDAFAVSVPVAQAFGRVGCFLNGCCPGIALPPGGAFGGLAIGELFPQQLAETAADLALAAVLWSMRLRPRPQGRLFRYYIAGYAGIRFLVEFVRGDTGPRVGPIVPLTLVQWVCLAAVVGVGLAARRVWVPPERTDFT